MRRLAWGSAIATLAVITFWSMTQSEGLPQETDAREMAVGDAEPTSSLPTPEDPGGSPVAPEPTPAPPSNLTTGAVKTREYALGLHELRGLAATVQPGIVFELWATWEPPVTTGPVVKKIVPEVLVTEVIPPMTADGPTAVVVSIPLKYMRNFVYAHRWGTLSVALL